MRITLLGAPTTAGSHNAGQEDAPAALRAAGLADALRRQGVSVEDSGDTPATPYRPLGVGLASRDLDRVTAQAAAVADGVAQAVADGHVPLVLGGDCTITAGVVAGALRAGLDPALAYFDGDLDLSTPADSGSGVLDSMVLAHLLGNADNSLARLGPRFPMLAPDRVLAVGFHPVEASTAQLAWAEASGLHLLPVTRLTDPASVRKALPDDGPVIVHFDLDVIDSGDFPLANFPHFNGGLTADAAFECLRSLCAAPQLAAVAVTEVNPHHDPDGAMVARLVDALALALGRD
ncbi:arginase family protein [Cryptosporangium phraense]|uniref:Arginase family protein n=1 Tax=Cryptosporangium phraense TaxID=2593070 RepID=A0A545AG61_9ACTN|nr:arginase family protein [Cryptosporangium phraense]TQS39625.1 arginase family protein [Cryptosporangium phraense]